MTQTLGAITVLVSDCDEAIACCTAVLGFRLPEHTAPGAGKRRGRELRP